MNNKTYLSLELGGKKRGLKFDLGAKETLVELYKTHPDAVNTESRSAAFFIYAGATSVCEIKGEAIDFTIEDCIKWAKRLDREELDEIAATWDKAWGIKTEAATEGGEDTQQQTA